MADLTGELHRGGSVTLDGSGNGTITLFPDHANQYWQIRHVAVFTNQSATATPIPTVTLYVNSTQSAQSARGASRSGSNDIFEGLIRVGPCDVLNIVWTGGIAGTVASATVEGDFRTRRS